MQDGPEVKAAIRDWWTMTDFDECVWHKWVGWAHDVVQQGLNAWSLKDDKTELEVCCKWIEWYTGIFHENIQVDKTRKRIQKQDSYITLRGYRYLGEVYLVYKMQRKYLKFKLT
jgi:hypothetical protein